MLDKWMDGLANRQTDRQTNEHCVWQNQLKQKKNIWANIKEVIAHTRFLQSPLK
jgi:hypothetical protein